MKTHPANGSSSIARSASALTSAKPRRRSVTLAAIHIWLPAGARLRAVATSGDQSQRTARAIAWIKDNFAKPLRIEELAGIAGMGVSTLHHHFRALTAMSPLQYQKQIRLQEARARMSVHGLDAGSAALEVGYESASQFTREYKRLFGQTPMQDRRALRSAAAQLKPLGVS